MERAFYPVIVFAFSRQLCEVYAKAIVDRGIDFNSDEERAAVDAVFENALQVLPEEDRDLAQVRRTIFLPLPAQRPGGGMFPMCVTRGGRGRRCA